MDNFDAFIYGLILSTLTLAALQLMAQGIRRIRAATAARDAADRAAKRGQYRMATYTKRIK